jgi:hypothetical protein
MVILEDCNMIRARLIDHADGAVLEGGIELLEAWSQARQTLWLDLENEAPDAERSLLESRFGISPLAVDDAQRQRHPPKLELFDGYLFLLLKGFSAETDSIDFSVIHIGLRQRRPPCRLGLAPSPGRCLLGLTSAPRSVIGLRGRPGRRRLRRGRGWGRLGASATGGRDRQGGRQGQDTLLLHDCSSNE